MAHGYVGCREGHIASAFGLNDTKDYPEPKYFGGNYFWRRNILEGITFGENNFGGEIFWRENFWRRNILEGMTFGEKYYLDNYFGGLANRVPR